MNYRVESKIREFDKKYAKEGDIYLYFAGTAQYIKNTRGRKKANVTDVNSIRSYFSFIPIDIV